MLEVFGLCVVLCIFSFISLWVGSDVNKWL